MAHLTCVGHGYRALVLQDPKGPYIEGPKNEEIHRAIVVHRRDGRRCRSNLGLTIRYKLYTPAEVLWGGEGKDAAPHVHTTLGSAKQQRAKKRRAERRKARRGPG